MLERNQVYVLVVLIAVSILLLGNLNQPTGYAAGDPDENSNALPTPTPFPNQCGTFKELSTGKIGIITKSGVQLDLEPIGCEIITPENQFITPEEQFEIDQAQGYSVGIDTNRYACPIETHFSNGLCCTNQDCSTNQICESSGLRTGFCKNVCSTPIISSCIEEDSDSVAIEIDISTDTSASQFYIQWCPLGKEWNSEECDSGKGETKDLSSNYNKIATRELEEETAYIIRVRTHEGIKAPVVKIYTLDTICVAPSEWSEPIRCDTTA